MLFIVANTYEFNHGLSKKQNDPPSGIRRQLFTASSLCAALSANPKAAVVLPQKPHDDWIEYTRANYSFASHLIYPTNPTPQLSRYLAVIDQPIAKGLPQQEQEELTAVPWGYTHEFFDLCANAGWGEPWRNNDSSTEFVTEIEWLDTKIGSHDFLTNVIRNTGSTIRRPEAAELHTDDPNALNFLEKLFRSWKRLIVKPNRSWGGRGSFAIASSDDLLSAESYFDGLSQESWHDRAFLIERYVGSAADQPSPTADAVVDFAGHQRPVIVGQMRIRDYRCLGTQYDEFIVSRAITNKIEEFTLACRQELKRLGYAGWFDVDFLIAEDSIWATEINVRMTGGTVPLLLMETLYGPNWKTTRGLSTRDGLECGTSRNIQSLIQEVEARGKISFGSSFKMHLLNLDYASNRCLFSALLVADRDVSLTGAIELLESVTQRY